MIRGGKTASRVVGLFTYLSNGVQGVEKQMCETLLVTAEE